MYYSQFCIPADHGRPLGINPIAAHVDKWQAGGQVIPFTQTDGSTDFVKAESLRDYLISKSNGKTKRVKTRRPISPSAM